MQQPGASVLARLSCLVAGVLILLVLNAGLASAQVSGKVQGTVTDEVTGQPLVGAQVVIEGTNLGNVTNEDGYYFINNVPVGIQAITAQYLGYQTLSQEERILAGQTMSVSFALSSEIIETAGILVEIEREPLVARDNTISKTRFTGEQTRDLPVDDIESVVSLGAGIYEGIITSGLADGNNGFIIRGGRGTESATFVDGALVTDFNDQINATEIGKFGVEEVDVVTGGFNAEFGNAQSGIINIVTREGGREFHGNVRYTTDELSEGIEQSYGFNNVQASVGGPIVPDKLTFFGTVEATGAEDFFPRAAGFNPREGFTSFDTDGDGTPDRVSASSNGSTESVLPGNRGDETRAQGKVTAFLTPTTKASATYLFSRDQFEDFDNRLHLEQFRGRASRTRTHDFILGFDQQLFQTAERNLNLQIRGNFHQTKFFQALPHTPELAAEMANRFGACGVECQGIDDVFEEDFLNWRYGDVSFFFEDSIPGTLPDLGSTMGRRQDFPDPVFGLPGLNTTAGIFTTQRDREVERRYGIRADLDSQLNRVHRMKFGVEWQWINLLHSSGNLTSSTFAENWDVDPQVGAAYVQDRLDYGDLVIDLGLRWDHWEPNTMFPEVAGVVPCDLAGFPLQCTEGAPALEAETRNEISPRIGVAHPITDATQVRLSYGKFYQLPRLTDLFSSFNTNFPGNPNIFYGNPNLDLIETTAFEAGITHLISENVVLDVVAYNRDRRGAVRLQVFQPDEIAPGISERRIFVNGDNGNVKGFDVTLSKRFSNYFSTDVAWSLQFARGTSSSPLDWVAGGGFGRLTDPLNPSNLLLPPVQLQAEDFDRLHNLNWQFLLRFPDDFRDGTASGAILKNLGVYLVYNAQSGVPFTRREPSARAGPLEDLNSSRLPWIHSGDIRVTKGFVVGELDLSVFALVQNFLDIENEIRINQTSGRADVGGLEDDLLAVVPSSTFFQEGTFTGRFPYRVEDLIETDPERGVPIRDRIALQDLNGDGLITQAEAKAVAIEATRTREIIGGTNANVFADDPENYGAPRQIRFGAEFRF